MYRDRPLGDEDLPVLVLLSSSSRDIRKDNVRLFTVTPVLGSMGSWIAEAFSDRLISRELSLIRRDLDCLTSLSAAALPSGAESPPNLIHSVQFGPPETLSVCVQL